MHDGAVWLKSVGRGSAHEPALVDALGEWAPEHVLVPLAVDRGERLMLLPDGGATMRAAGRESSSVDAWAAMLADYARLQLEVARHADEMSPSACRTSAPKGFPQLVPDLLDDDEFQLRGHPDGLTEQVRDRLRAGLGEFGELCRRLADSGVPATVQHDDLHDANVFVADGRYRFFDWGDASVAHPFLSLRVPLRVAREALGVPDGDPVLVRLRDAYLEPWSGHGSPAALRELVRIALRVSPLPRAMTWRRILRGVHPAERTEWESAVPWWTAEYLEPGTLSEPAAAPVARPGDGGHGGDRRPVR